MIIECPVSLGELVDKISILIIKKKNINDSEKIKNVETELHLLIVKLESLNLDSINKYLDKLVEVNSELWKIEDDIREKERASLFDDEFIKLARSVYVTNDRRFEVKNAINNQYGSGVKEVKSYEDY